MYRIVGESIDCEVVMYVWPGVAIHDDVSSSRAERRRRFNSLLTCLWSRLASVFFELARELSFDGGIDRRG